MLATRAAAQQPRSELFARKAEPAEPPVHIGVYDGPLDLLLYLVRREGVALREVPLAKVCEAYLQHLHGLDDIDVDSAGEYLSMASTLCLLKARELLPRSPNAPAEDEEEDPRRALELRLMEYERFRQAGSELGARQMLDRDVFARPPLPVPANETVIEAGADAWGLANLFYGLLDRRSEPPPVHQVALESYTMAETVRRVLQHLEDGEEHTLSELFVDMPFRRARLFTFLAVLESARFQLVEVWQRIHLGAIGLRGRTKAEDADLSSFQAHEQDDAEGA